LLTIHIAAPIGTSPCRPTARKPQAGNKKCEVRTILVNSGTHFLCVAEFLHSHRGIAALPNDV
jgi:hypothetical protein